MPRSSCLLLLVCGCFTKPPPPELGNGSGSSDGGANGVEPNYAFVTSTMLPLAQLTSLDAADTRCMDAAQTAGLPGTYRAWMSTSTEAAQSRFGAARGWIRTDHKPFADSIDDLVTTRRMFYPLRIDENGRDLRTTDPAGNHAVATGTTKAGSVAQNCFDLTGSGMMTYGFADDEGASWTDTSNVTCSSSSLRLYCFGVDRTSQIDPPISTPGPRVFLSETAVPLSALGVAVLDRRCTDDAAAANPPLAGRFRAIVALTQQSAVARISATGQTWVRVDGVEATSDFNTLEAPLNVTARAHYLDGVETWNGAQDPSTPGTGTCGDWTVNSSGLAAVGDSERATSDAFGLPSLYLSCGSAGINVYCAQVP